MGIDWVIKLAVIEHLSPDVVIDDATDVLKKLPVNVLRYGSPGFGRVNAGVNRLSLARSEKRKEDCRE
jgi:hypothetical protein